MVLSVFLCLFLFTIFMVRPAFIAFLVVTLVGCMANAPVDTANTSMSASGIGVQTLAGSGTTPSGSGGTVAIKTEQVNYGAANGYLALPQTEGTHPAVVLIHEWWGLNDNMRWYAEQFAKQGYVALAVDLYGGQSTQDPAKAQELAGGVQKNMTGAFMNLESAVAYLKTRPEVDSSRIASVGWCFGGGWSYQMAKNNMGVKATVMYYGQFSPKDDLSMMKAHIIGHFGEKDTSIPVDDVKTFRAKLQTLSGENQVFIYPNEGHGFARELNTPAAKLAWERTLKFLKEQL
ncbi:MAG: putative dienelactone hydrolase family [Candidatus Peribacteria bacterium]|nr:putative dienelactone hydrolase family [Candidatus Peribacteria bacterium]